MSAGAPLHRLAMALRRGDAEMAAAAGMKNKGIKKKINKKESRKKK
jgi:hypothetical protein